MTTTRFDVRAARSFVDLRLASPPALDRLHRLDGVGFCVARFVLPLDVCEPQNRTRYLDQHIRGRVKTKSLTLMRAQYPRPGDRALPGRPMVRCIRFSSREPDRFADWAKYPIDHLRESRMVRGKLRPGLGFIVDDSPRFCRVEQTWEPAPPACGVVLIEVWTGEDK